MFTPEEFTLDVLSAEPANIKAWMIFDKYVPTQIAVPLYHYTTLAGFKGIIESRAIWATDSKYLNDPSEAIYGRAIIRAAIEQACASCSPAVARAIALIPNGLEEIGTRRSSYFTSFSEAGDLLNQWVAYTPSANGVAIGVDGRYISDRYHVRKVLYNSGGQRSE